MRKCLYVYVPGLMGRLHRWKPLMARLKKEKRLQGVDWLPFSADAGPASRATAFGLARALQASIDDRWQKAGGYDEVVLIGYSFGGLLVRQAYLLASGIYPDLAPAVPWAERVCRIVLLASMNRGMKPERSLRLRAGALLASCIPGRVLIDDLFAGSTFVTELRLQWIQHFRRLGSKAPSVVQVIGSDDREVTAEDSIDVLQFGSAGHLVVPHATHTNLHCIGELPDPPRHYRILRRAILGDVSFPATAQPKGPDVVVFLMHGIRAFSIGWVERLQERIAEEATRSNVCVQIVAPQNYLSALEFAIAPLQRRKVRWFLDRYSGLAARYPDAEFHFVGHSNGTYLAGAGMKNVRAMRFKRVHLAGAVLPTDFDWNLRVARGQVGSVRNDCADADYPVGILCRGLALLGRDVGVAGMEGFGDGCEAVQNRRYFRGGHGAAFEEEERLIDIGRFLFSDDAPAELPRLVRSIPWLRFMTFRFAALILACGILFLPVALCLWPAATLVAIAILAVFLFVL